MKSFILMVIAMVCVVSLEAQNKSFYDFTVRTIDGKEFPLSSLKGKKVLVVNVASKCGLTPQYAKLQELYIGHPPQLKDCFFSALPFVARFSIAIRNPYTKNPPGARLKNPIGVNQEPNTV